MEEAVEKLRPQFDALLAIRNENNQGLTQQGMADKLNTDNILSLTGQPWSKYSVRRILKKLSMQTEMSASQAKSSPSPSPATPLPEHSERDLDEHSPLRLWSYYESIRNVIEELTAKPYTTQDLAEQLNKREIATSDGKPWDKSAVTRVLRTLKPSNNGIQSSDDEIRSRIKQGLYDTEFERFIVVSKEKKENKKIQAKAEKIPKKEKKAKKIKNEKGKGKGKKSK